MRYFLLLWLTTTLLQSKELIQNHKDWNLPVSNEDYDNCARYAYKSDWKIMGRDLLNFTDYDIDFIDGRFNSTFNKTKQTFNVWRDLSDETTYAIFVNYFYSIRRKHLIYKCLPRFYYKKKAIDYHK